MTEPMKGPLMVCIGGNSCRIGSSFGPRGSNILFLDTDRRSLSDEMDLSLLVGEDVVEGEGSGGNLNLARACFKMDMEKIAPKILGRPLVMIISSTEGSTGIAGSVEISSLLVKLGMPTFSFLLHDSSQQRGGMDPLHVASMLLDGPLRPGCILIKGSDEGSPIQDPYGLSTTIPFFLSGMKRTHGFLLPPTCWAILREDGGPFEIGPIEIDSEIQRMDIKTPAVIFLCVPEDWTTDTVRSILEGTFGNREGIYLGLTMESGIDNIRGAYIAKTAQKIPAPQGPPPDPDMLKDLLGGPLDMEIVPSRNIQ